MGFAQAKKITSWSFSRYNDYELCPLQAKYKHVQKLQEPKNVHMARGGDVHRKAEEYLNGKLKKLPDELKLFADLFKTLRDARKQDPECVIVEDTWAFTSKWEKTRWDNWDECWLRIKLDCAWWDEFGILHVEDWKTGKFKDTDTEGYGKQLELYALGALLTFPEAKVVMPRLVYTDTSVIWAGMDPRKPMEFKQSDLERLKKTWTKRTLPMLSDTTFAPKPSDKCRYCWFGQNKRQDGGPGLCKF